MEIGLVCHYRQWSCVRVEPVDKQRGLGLLGSPASAIDKTLWAAGCVESVLKQQIHRQTAARRL